MQLEDLRPIAELCIQHDLLVLSDEIYCELVYNGTKTRFNRVPLPGMKERTVLLNGLFQVVCDDRISESATLARLRRSSKQ